MRNEDQNQRGLKRAEKGDAGEGLIRLIGNSFLVFCKKHCFNPTTVICMAVFLIAAMLSFAAAGTVTTARIKSRPVQFGLHGIGELATQVGYYTNVQVIEGSRELWGWQIPLTQSKYVFSYDGIIKAGLDFAEIELSVNPLTNTVRIVLPEMQVLSNEIDTESLEIYDETNNIFTPLKVNDINQSFGELKVESEENAINNGLFTQAKANAELIISGFLSSTYDPQVYTIEYVWPQ